MSSLPLPFRLGQRPCLDGLRGLAVVSVVAAHLGVISGGVVGVDILFALSGFLITVLLVEEQEKKGAVSLKSFYRKRFLRILPSLAFVLLAGSIAAVLLGLSTPYSVAAEALLSLTFLSNWQVYLPPPMPTFGHTWTLSLEVQFYLLWPVALTLLLATGARRRYVLALLGVGIVVSAGWRIALFTLQPFGAGERRAYLMRLFMGLDTHADTLLIGCLAGLVVAWQLLPQTDRFRRHLRVAGYLSLAGLGYMALRCHQEQFVYYYGLSLVLAVLVGVVLVWWTTESPRLLWLFERPALVGLGRISYALYLFHVPLIRFCQPVKEAQGPTVFAIVVASLSLVLAILCYYLIERPVLSLRHKKTALPDVSAPPVSAKAA